MPTASTRGIDLCYETFGDPADPAMLLVAGAGVQLIGWHERFCGALSEHGLYVIRFDNRDVGLSTHLDGVEVDLASLGRASRGRADWPPVPYTLSDLGADAFGLLDHLNIPAAHLVGRSMGGFVVQTMAIEQPERVLSLTSIMSTTGEPDVGQARPELVAALQTPPPSERAAFIETETRKLAAFASSRYFDAASAAEAVGAAFDRAFYPGGMRRQVAAILASGDRAEGLRALTVPTLVIHGMADELVDKSGGLRTAELVPGANLLLLHDMGHDLPEPLWPLVVDAVVSHITHCVA